MSLVSKNSFCHSASCADHILNCSEKSRDELYIKKTFGRLCNHLFPFEKKPFQNGTKDRHIDHHAWISGRLLKILLFEKYLKEITCVMKIPIINQDIF